MHPHVADVFQILDASRAALRAAVDAVPAPLRQQRPAADRWSVAEVLEHLSLVETRFTQALAGRLEEARHAGLAAETSPSRDPLPAKIAGMLADRTAPRNAPDPARPSGALDATAAWQAAEQARAAFRTLIASADGLALSTVIHAHPFFGALNIYQWVELIAGHERRHTAQVADLAAQLAVR
jgi:uncharacterized damage-inducible protein DinB